MVLYAPPGCLLLWGKDAALMTSEGAEADLAKSDVAESYSAAQVSNLWDLKLWNVDAFYIPRPDHTKERVICSSKHTQWLQVQVLWFAVHCKKPKVQPKGTL